MDKKEFEKQLNEITQTYLSTDMTEDTLFRLVYGLSMKYVESD